MIALFTKIIKIRITRGETTEPGNDIFFPLFIRKELKQENQKRNYNNMISCLNDLLCRLFKKTRKENACDVLCTRLVMSSGAIKSYANGNLTVAAGHDLRIYKLSING